MVLIKPNNVFTADVWIFIDEIKQLLEKDAGMAVVETIVSQKILLRSTDNYTEIAIHFNIQLMKVHIELIRLRNKRQGTLTKIIRMIRQLGIYEEIQFDCVCTLAMEQFCKSRDYVRDENYPPNYSKSIIFKDNN